MIRWDEDSMYGCWYRVGYGLCTYDVSECLFVWHGVVGFFDDSVLFFLFLGNKIDILFFFFPPCALSFFGHDRFAEFF